MKPAENEWYIGIELGSRWTQVSCYHRNLKEPETKSTIAGAGIYRIPTAICKRKSTGQWCFGEEASRLAESGEGLYADYLLERSLKQDTVFLGKDYQAVDLLMVFLRKVLRMALPAEGAEAVTKCVFTVEKVTIEIVQLLKTMAEKLELTEEQLIIQDFRESFYAYAVCQEAELWQHDVMLFYCNGDEVWQQRLTCDKNTKPRIAEVEERCMGMLPEDVKEWDLTFARMVHEAMSGRIVSSVYLIGSGFDGNWMQESLQAVCRGRRAFQGKNLYTRGACYSGMLICHQEEAETVYFCEYKLKEHLLLKVTKGDGMYFYPLVEAGSDRHQIGKDVRIVIEGEPELELWIQKPGSREARVESLDLEGLPAGNGRRRLALSLYLGDGGEVLLKIRDIGWGELKSGTGREWEYELY